IGCGEQRQAKRCHMPGCQYPQQIANCQHNVAGQVHELAYLAAGVPVATRVTRSLYAHSITCLLRSLHGAAARRRRCRYPIIFISTRLHLSPRSCFCATLPHARMTQIISLPPLDAPRKCATNMTPGTRASFSQPGTLVGVEYTASSR